MDRLTCMMSGTITTTLLQKRMNQGAQIYLQVTIAFLNSPKPNTMGKLKTRLVSEVSTSVKSDIYIGERQK